MPVTTSVPIAKVDVAAYRVPTDLPESDGTLEWNATTIVVVHASAGGRTGLGYTYADTAAALLVHEQLAGLVRGRDALDIPGAHDAMARAVRNLGRPGVASMAIAAVDTALWDLKARLLDLPLTSLLGRVRTSVPVYGSGGFTSYDDGQLCEQLSGWVEQGIRMVKMKVGREPERDIHRVRVAREAIGDGVALFVDANGAYDRARALAMAEAFAAHGVTWFEEPVSSDDLEGLRMLRDRAPAGMAIAAGEYGYDLPYLRRMLEAGAVDVLQVDATRCGGVSVLLGGGALCAARSLPLSAHTAPDLHAHACCAIPAAVHVEWFHDHARVEHLLFDGALDPVDGALRPDPARTGMGLTLREADARRYAL